MSTLYKITDHDGSARMGSGSWHLPKGKRPGKWMAPIVGDLVACQNGYHLCREADLLDWLGPAIFEVEYRGEMIEADNKIVVREARLLRKCGGWNESTARLFAADCAARVLPIFEKEHPDDKRPRKAIAAARAYARGEIGDAAWTAAGAAALAARAAARAAAGGTAAWAAGAAAWTADWAAAWAAGAAARAAAGAAVRAAGAAAAGAAEQQWQQKRLLDYLTGRAPEARKAA